jgi:geranylgeranylglyceryl phosphate synthase family protein
MRLLKLIEEKCAKKAIAVLLDPDKLDVYSLSEIIKQINIGTIDYVFVGGSLITSDRLNWLLSELKAKTTLPKILFPGNSTHINQQADGILLLSLISGRNPEFLIGQHVVSAPLLKQSNLDILPTGYILVDGGKPTTVSYISNTFPVPNDKAEVAAATALAGVMLGLRLIYLDAGSGAKQAVSTLMIEAVKKQIESTPLIVGGGLKTVEQIEAAWTSGADIVVIGNAIEENPSFLAEITALKKEISKI